jgi:hypothetical protein
MALILAADRWIVGRSAWFAAFRLGMASVLVIVGLWVGRGVCRNLRRRG